MNLYRPPSLRWILMLKTSNYTCFSLKLMQLDRSTCSKLMSPLSRQSLSQLLVFSLRFPLILMIFKTPCQLNRSLYLCLPLLLPLNDLRLLNLAFLHLQDIIGGIWILVRRIFARIASQTCLLPFQPINLLVQQQLGPRPLLRPLVP